MTVKAVNQATIVDVTDAYSVILDNEAHTFIGSTSTLGTAQSATAKVTAMLGGDVVAASVTLSEVTAPTGVTVSKDTDATSPTLTFSLAATVAAGGTITIPVHVGTDITINKTFSFSIAFKGATGNDVASTTRYYLLQSSTLAAPSKPTASPPSGSWQTTEPTYTEGSTNSLYTCDQTVFSDGTWSYSSVSLSTSYEAAKAAYNKAVAAAKLATAINNYFSQDSAGAHVSTVEGNPDSGYNLLLEATMIALRLDETDLMRLADNMLELGCNSTNAQIKLCGRSATMSAEKTSDARYPSDSSYPSETSYPSAGAYFNVVAPAGVRIEGNGCSIATGATSASDTTSSVILQGPNLRIQDGTHDGVFDMSKLYDLLNT